MLSSNMKSINYIIMMAARRKEKSENTVNDVIIIQRYQAEWTLIKTVRTIFSFTFRIALKCNTRGGVECLSRSIGYSIELEF